MPSLTETLQPQDLASMANLQMFAKRVVEGLSTGMHASPHKGYSVEFKQHRPYVSGDEIKHIDWKVFARTDRHYIREYEEETNLRCSIVLDASGSMGYTGTAGVQKYDYARRTAACLAYLMMTQQDAVGMATFDTEVRQVVPPRSRVSHLRALMDAVETTGLGGETGLAEVLKSLVPRLGRRGLVIVLSDCFTEDVPAVTRSLAHLRHRGHEVLIMQIWDRDELEFPFEQWTKFINMENVTDEQMIDPATLRKSYMANLEAYREAMKQSCQRNRIDLVPLVTDEPYADTLARYMAFRQSCRRK